TDMYSPTTAFQTARRSVDNLSTEQDPTIMLLAYALFKQTTAGDIAGARPGAFSLRARSKFDAWTTTKGMAHEVADALYINCAEHMVEGRPLNQQNQDLVRGIAETLRWL
ncbi:acyl-CoA binding protein, partial [Tuber magnatum]